MDEEIERLVVSVRADTQGFAQDVSAMRAELDGPFADGLERAGRALENGLIRAIQRGKFGFEDLRRLALSVLADIAAAAIRTGLDSIFSGAGGRGGNGGLFAGLANVLGGILGAPGRATGGPVPPGRAYRVAKVALRYLCQPAAGGLRQVRLVLAVLRSISPSTYPTMAAAAHPKCCNGPLAMWRGRSAARSKTQEDRSWLTGFARSAAINILAR